MWRGREGGRERKKKTQNSKKNTKKKTNRNSRQPQLQPLLVLLHRRRLGPLPETRPALVRGLRDGDLAGRLRHHGQRDDELLQFFFNLFFFELFFFDFPKPAPDAGVPRRSPPNRGRRRPTPGRPQLLRHLSRPRGVRASDPAPSRRDVLIAGPHPQHLRVAGRRQVLGVARRPRLRQGGDFVLCFPLPA